MQVAASHFLAGLQKNSDSHQQEGVHCRGVDLHLQEADLVQKVEESLQPHKSMVNPCCCFTLLYLLAFDAVASDSSAPKAL